jgi:hypothetical protein
MTDALSRLAQEATGGSAARLARLAQDKALAVEQQAAAGKPGSYAPKPVSTLSVAAIGSPAPDAVTPLSDTLLRVEVESRQAVTVEEAQAYALSPEQMALLASLRNEQTFGGDGRVSETAQASDLNALDELGLLDI